ncbi:hypothetical protein ES707_06029 [subsurface metagenome]
MRQGVPEPDSVVMMFSPAVETDGLMWRLSADGYGLGHALEILPDGRRLVSHGGQNSGWISHYALVPESGEGIVVLTNSERSFLLIARILADWARWQGLGGVKPSQALLGTAVVIRSVAISLLLVSLTLGGCLAFGLAAGNRGFSLKFRDSRFPRVVQIVLVFILLRAGWGITRLGLMELFPVLSVWLFVSLLTCAPVLLLIALFPGKTATVTR